MNAVELTRRVVDTPDKPTAVLVDELTVKLQLADREKKKRRITTFDAIAQAGYWHVLPLKM